MVDRPTIRDVLIDLDDNGGHPKISVDTGNLVKSDISPDEFMSTLSTQRAMKKRFLSTNTTVTQRVCLTCQTILFYSILNKGLNRSQ